MIIQNINPRQTFTMIIKTIQRTPPVARFANKIRFLGQSLFIDRILSK